MGRDEHVFLFKITKWKVQEKTWKEAVFWVQRLFPEKDYDMRYVQQIHPASDLLFAAESTLQHDVEHDHCHGDQQTPAPHHSTQPPNVHSDQIAVEPIAGISRKHFTISFEYDKGRCCWAAVLGVLLVR